MNGSTILITIIAGVCLLVFGLRLVQNGFTRAYGAKLKSFIANNTKSILRSFLSGLTVTAIVQSSTATSLIVSAFAEKKLVPLGGALAVLLGSDVGTTLIAQALSFNLNFLMPLFIIVGVIGYSTFKEGTIYYVSRAIIGLGLMLLALGIITGASNPLGESEVAKTILASLDKDVYLTFIVAVLLTWLSHSSLATILFVMTLASQGLLTLPVSLVFVTGATVGGAIAPLIMNLRSIHGGRNVTIGEFSMRFCGALIILPFIGLISSEYAWILGETPARQVVNFHTFFSIARAIVFLPLTPLIAKMIISFLPKTEEKIISPANPMYLDENALETPAIAISCAARETLRMGDIVGGMLEKSILMFENNDKIALKEIHETEDAIDSLYSKIKFYTTRISLKGLTKHEGTRAVEILTFATNLEHIGDILDKNINELAQKKFRKDAMFSKDGMEEIVAVHSQVCKNMRLALNVFMSDDVKLARKLVRDKELLREMADKSQEKHFKRLRDGKSETVQSSSIHIDIIRDYARINSHLTDVAYTLLDAEGALQSRIKKGK